MSEGDISQISVGEFETVSQLLASSESLQLAFIIMIVGIILIAAAYRTFSSMIKSKKYFTLDHIYQNLYKMQYYHFLQLL